MEDLKTEEEYYFDEMEAERAAIKKFYDDLKKKKLQRSIKEIKYGWCD